MRDKNKLLQHHINEVISSINPNSIIGKPIVLNENLTVIPVVKSTTFYLGGGGEYGEVKVFSVDKNQPFAGGVGTLINTAPYGFLVCNKDGCNFVNVPTDLTEKLFDKSFEFFKKAANYNV